MASLPLSSLPHLALLAPFDARLPHHLPRPRRRVCGGREGAARRRAQRDTVGWRVRSPGRENRGDDSDEEAANAEEDLAYVDGDEILH